MASNKLRTRIVYTAEAVDQMSDKEVRAAYSSIRHIAVERSKRLQSYGFTNTRAAKEAQRLNFFPPLAEMSDEETRQMLLDTSVWLRNKYSKAAEVRRKNRQAMKAFRKMGYQFIDETNIIDFLEFMDDMKEQYADKNYEYTRIAEAYDLAQKYQIPEEELRRDFENWMKDTKTLPRIEALGEGATSADVRNLVKGDAMRYDKKKSSRFSQTAKRRRRNWKSKK